MRHHGRAEDAERHQQRRGIRNRRRHRPQSHRAPVGLGEKDRVDEAQGDRRDQRHHHRLDLAEAEVDEQQQQQHVEPGDKHAPHQRQPKQQVERHRRADHLGQIAGDDRDLAQQPQRHRDGPRIIVAARLREVAPRHDAEPSAQDLQEDRHQVRREDDPQQTVAELAPTSEIGPPIARVHIADRDQEPRPGKAQPLPPARTPRIARRPYLERAVRLGQRRRQVWRRGSVGQCGH